MAAPGARPDHHIIEGTFEIDHSPWIFFCGIKRNLAIRIHSSEKKDPSSGKGLASDPGYPSVWKLAEREKVPVVLGIGRKINLPNKITKFKLKFKVGKEFGSPGAFVVENNGKKEFFLKSATLRSIVPDKDEEFHFNCNSWVYPRDKTKVKRVFFINRLYLPSETPPGLVKFRKKELEKLRKGGSQGERKPWDRIYEYDLYNDLGDPDKGREYSRPVLGGVRFPYPRRLRTGRPHCQQEHSAESRPAGCFEVYVPPDERLSHEKQEELINNLVIALVSFLTPKSDELPPAFEANPGLIKKIAHTLLPKVAFSSAENFRVMFQSIVDFFKRKPKSVSDQDSGNLDSMEDIFKFFSEKEGKELGEWERKKLENLIPDDILMKVTTTAATKRKLENSQLPSIIAEEIYAWSADEEFGRQMLAGTNPVRIRLLQESDITSGTKFDDKFEDEIRKNQKEKKAFILEHKDCLLPYLDAINGKGVCAYATRTILKCSGRYKKIEPIAIELCLPHSEQNRVIIPKDDYLWLLAKAHVAANDAAHHQLVSHWLHTHAVIEPFIIATRRQLSVMHPIHRLLDPHFKDTLHINALARAIFLNAGGILERTLFTGEYSMSLSSEFYNKEWRFDKQALPSELESRGMAVAVKEEIVVMPEIEHKQVEEDDVQEERSEDMVEGDEGPGEIDENAVELDDNAPAKDDKTPDKQEEIPGGVKLILEDYPYANDGLEIWYAIETWVRDYCEIFYTSDDSVKGDEEIEAWWKEIKNDGHRDKNEGWYELTNRKSLVRALTTLIWITSGLHAAVNFGQYAYAGWPPNRPMLLRKFIPKQRTQEHYQLVEDPEKFLTEMWPEKFDMAFVIAVMDLFSRHTSDEAYLGQRPLENESDENGKKVNEKSKMFREKLREIEKKIKERNKRYDLMNRWGNAKIPYKLLYPDTDKTKPPPSEDKDRQHREDISGRGIPNSISI